MRYYLLVIFVLICLQVVSVFITLKFSLFTTQNIETRDIFVSNDIRTKHLDVETEISRDT
jgi:hypothetical protein